MITRRPSGPKGGEYVDRINPALIYTHRIVIPVTPSLIFFNSSVFIQLSPSKELSTGGDHRGFDLAFNDAAGASHHVLLYLFIEGEDNYIQTQIASVDSKVYLLLSVSVTR